jgi:predicted DNA-binding transcriptional regulator AlpA
VTSSPDNPDTPTSLWDINDLSAFLKVPVETIYQWRKKGYGPKPVRGGKMGRHLRWLPQTVFAWLAVDDEAA